MPTVNFNGKTVSDQDVKDVLQNIADYFGADVNVTSGDRNYVPPGGSTSSKHLVGRAADFHIVGVPDVVIYENLKNFGWDHVFEFGHFWTLLYHGPHTGTTGEHIHLHRTGTSSNSRVRFQIEGLTADTKNDYQEEVVKTVSKKLSDMFAFSG